FAFAGAGRKEEQSECGCSGTDLDTVDSINLSGEGSCDVWFGRATRSSRSTRRNCTELCFSRVRRFVLHDWSGPASERRNRGQRIEIVGRLTSTPAGGLVNRPTF